MPRFHCPCQCTTPSGAVKYFLSEPAFVDHMKCTHQRAVKFGDDGSIVTTPITIPTIPPVAAVAVEPIVPVATSILPPVAPVVAAAAAAESGGPTTMASIMASPEFLAMVATIASNMALSANAIGSPPSVPMDVVDASVDSSDSGSDSDFIASQEEDDGEATVSYVDSSVSISLGGLGISMKGVTDEEKAIAIQAGLDAIQKLRSKKVERAGLPKERMLIKRSMI